MAKDEESNQLNLTVVALVALVAIVGLVALVMNAESVKTLATGSQLVSAAVPSINESTTPEQLGCTQVTTTTPAQYTSQGYNCLTSAPGSDGAVFCAKCPVQGKNVKGNVALCGGPTACSDGTCNWAQRRMVDLAWAFFC